MQDLRYGADVPQLVRVFVVVWLKERPGAQAGQAAGTAEERGGLGASLVVGLVMVLVDQNDSR